MTPRDEYGDPVTINDITDDPREIAEYWQDQHGRGRGFTTRPRRWLRDELGYVSEDGGASWRWEPDGAA